MFTPSASLFFSCKYALWKRKQFEHACFFLENKTTSRALIWFVNHCTFTHTHTHTHARTHTHYKLTHKHKDSLSPHTHTLFTLPAIARPVLTFHTDVCFHRDNSALLKAITDYFSFLFCKKQSFTRGFHSLTTSNMILQIFANKYFLHREQTATNDAAFAAQEITRRNRKLVSTGKSVEWGVARLRRPNQDENLRWFWTGFWAKVTQGIAIPKRHAQPSCSCCLQVPCTFPNQTIDRTCSPSHLSLCTRRCTFV